MPIIKPLVKTSSVKAGESNIQIIFNKTRYDMDIAHSLKLIDKLRKATDSFIEKRRQKLTESEIDKEVTEILSELDDIDG